MFVNFWLPASRSVHSYPKIANYCRKLHFFVGGWKELTLMTLSRNIGKINRIRQSEHIFDTFTLQASTCIHSHKKTGNFCRIVQIFVGGQNELTLMNLWQSSRKNTKIRQNEHIFVKSSLETSSCIHSYPILIKFCRGVQIYVGDQNELPLMNL